MAQMTAYLSDLETRASTFDPPPIVIVGDSEAAIERAGRTVEASGIRIAARVEVAAAAKRLDLQAAASAVWIELTGDGGEPMDALLDRVDRDVADGRYAAIVSTSADIVDAVNARIENPAVEVLVDEGEIDRAAALAVVLANSKRPLRVADAATDKSAARLRQLSDEVSRIASTLARLSTGPGAARMPEITTTGNIPDVPIEDVRAVIRARRMRSRYFAEDLFADPAWDMLLDLLQAEIAQLRVPVSSLCIAAAVPATTALRWLKSMTAQGIFLRRADPHDGRRVFVELSPHASQAMRRYFADVGKAAVI
jgi:DNA-binding MarR family transcriptional regulator